MKGDKLIVGICLCVGFAGGATITGITSRVESNRPLENPDSDKYIIANVSPAAYVSIECNAYLDNEWVDSVKLNLRNWEHEQDSKSFGILVPKQYNTNTDVRCRTVRAVPSETQVTFGETDASMYAVDR